MQIVQFKVDKLHGYLDITIPFFEDLTVILGVNGAGKTSALTFISALLRLDIGAVRRFKLERAELRALSETGEEIVLVVTADVTLLVLLTINGNTYDISSYSARDVISASRDVTYYEIADKGIPSANRMEWTNPAIFASYMGIEPSALKAAKEFLGKSRLTFVQLDRTIVAMSPDGEEVAERAFKLISAKGKVVEPIDEVIRVTKKKFLDYKTAVERIRDRAYKDSLRLHFEPITSAVQDKKLDRANFVKKLDDMKARVAKSGLTSNEAGLNSFASTFFSEFQTLFEESIKQKTTKRTGRRTLGEEQLDAILSLKRWQIERLLDIFETEARGTQEEYAPIRRYLAATERFFRESGKRLSFDKDYELGFTMYGGTAIETEEPRSLKELSSGERQILIILTYLAFVSGKNSVFVIDEPELSLHLVWQTLLVSAVKELRPEGCQVILATHAPEIAGKARDRTVRLGRQRIS